MSEMTYIGSKNEMSPYDLFQLMKKKQKKSSYWPKTTIHVHGCQRNEKADSKEHLLLRTHNKSFLVLWFDSLWKSIFYLYTGNAVVSGLLLGTPVSLRFLRSTVVCRFQFPE